MAEKSYNWQEAINRITKARNDGSDSIKLHGLGLTQLPSELFQLRNLKCLELWSNPLTKLPPEIAELNQLTHLYLSDSLITTLPAQISQLQHLTHLDLRNSKVATLPSQISKLQHLTYLDLRNNPITSLPPQISQLKNLRHLDLRNSKIVALPPQISQLQHLTYLDLRNNPMTSFPPQIVKLRYLDIKFEDDLYVKGINLYGTEKTLQHPPAEVLRQGWNAIKNYFTQFEQQGENKLFEAKLIFVGEGRAGKTSLMRALLNSPFDAQESSTKGIEIDNIVLPAADTTFDKDFRLNLWDFGGQEIYKDTHRFFLTKDTVYILVTENRKNVNYDDIYYWLNSLNIFAPNAPVLLVQNKCEQNVEDLPFQQYKREFKNLVPSIDLLRTSCIRGQEHTIKVLREKIIDVLKDKTLAPNIGDTIPARWVDIRNALLIRQQKGGKTLKYSTFEKVCMTRYKLSKEDVKTLAGYFFRIGVFVHYADDKLLKRTVFLDNEWLTKAVYKVIDDETVSNQKGRFSLHDIEAMYRTTDYAGQEAEFITLMKKFKICYEVKDNEYICPQRLPIDEPPLLNWGEWQSVKNLHYALEYPFMPRGILSTFIVNIHPYIIGESWRHGVVLQHNKAQALVYEDLQAKYIHIYIKGEDKRDFLAIIVNTLQNIHKELNDLPHKAKIACSCAECMENPAEAYLFDEERIMRCWHKGIETVQCNTSDANVSVEELAGFIRKFYQKKS